MKGSRNFSPPWWAVMLALVVNVLLLVMLVVLVVTSLSGCVTTKPVDAFTRPNGTRVGVSLQVVFLRPFSNHDAISVAQDHAEIAIIDSVTTTRRIRAIGTGYVTTVTGK